MDTFKAKLNFILVIMLICFISGCATRTQKEYVKTPVYVDIPVMQVPAIKPIERPMLEINSLSPDATPAQTVEAYYNSLQVLIKYVKLLEQALNPFYTEYKKNAKR